MVSSLTARLCTPGFQSWQEHFLFLFYKISNSYSTGSGSPRAEPEDKVCLRCHKSLATRVITVI